VRARHQDGRPRQTPLPQIAQRAVGLSQRVDLDLHSQRNSAREYQALTGVGTREIRALGIQRATDASSIVSRLYRRSRHRHVRSWCVVRTNRLQRPYGITLAHTLGRSGLGSGVMISLIFMAASISNAKRPAAWPGRSQRFKRWTSRHRPPHVPMPERQQDVSCHARSEPHTARSGRRARRHSRA
jgi:hypothetical protein